MFSIGSNERAKSAMRACFPSELCSEGHRQYCLKRWTYLRFSFGVLQTDFIPHWHGTGDSK